MNKPLWVSLIAIMLATIALLAAQVPSGGGPSAQVVTAQTATTMGIDPETTGNSASTLGDLEPCVRVDVPDPAFDNVSDYNIDVYVTAGTQAPMSYDAWVTYDATKVHVAAPGTDVLIKLPDAMSLGDPVPDSDGQFNVGVGYLTGGPGIAGDGALLRLGLDIGASGVVTFDLTKAIYTSCQDLPGCNRLVIHTITKKTAQLAINQDCPAGEPPVATVTPTAARTATPETRLSPDEGENTESSGGFPWALVFGAAGGAVAVVVVLSVLFMRRMRRS